MEGTVVNRGFSVLGQCLSTAEKVAVEAAAQQLALKERLDAPVLFWGKITGVQKDYLLMQCTNLDTKITKMFYWSNDGGLSFSRLADVDRWATLQAAVQHGSFSGDPSKLYRPPKAPKKPRDGDEEDEEEEEEEEEEEDEEDEEDESGERKLNPLKRKLTELERLAYTVQAIDQDTALIPRGALLQAPTSDIAPNHKFKGLSPHDAVSLENFLLLRETRSAQTQARARKEGLANTENFLDSAASQKPDGLWRVLSDQGQSHIRIRNLKWLGFEYHLLSGTRNFAGAYFGNGRVNQDLMFVL